MKQRLFFWVLQDEGFGGSELVEINLANKFCDKYETHLIFTSKHPNGVFYIDPKVIVHNLEMPMEIARVREKKLVNKNSKRYFSNFILNLRFIYHFYVKREYYRRKVRQLVNQDDILVCSGFDSYWFAPKKNNLYFHFHFDTRDFLTLSNKITLKIAATPNKYIFLSNNIRINCEKGFKKAKGRSTWVYNWRRSPRNLDVSFKGGKLCFIGRLDEQKNPLLIPKIAKHLMCLTENFKIDIYGKGHLDKAIEEEIAKNHVQNYVSFYNRDVDVTKILPQYDILLFPSISEGFGLIKQEANGYSLPCLSSYWGDSTYDAFDGNNDGFVIENHDPKKYAEIIYDLLTDSEKLKKLKYTSYERSKEFDPEKIVEKWSEILDLR